MRCGAARGRGEGKGGEPVELAASFKVGDRRWRGGEGRGMEGSAMTAEGGLTTMRPGVSRPGVALGNTTGLPFGPGERHVHIRRAALGAERGEGKPPSYH